MAAFYSRGRAGTGLHAFTMKHKGARKGGPTTVGTCAPGRRIARLGPAWARYAWRAAGQGLRGVQERTWSTSGHAVSQRPVLGGHGARGAG